MQEILVWHPKFNIYVLDNQDILLISEMGCFSLPHDQFVLFNQFEGIKSTEQIIAEQGLTAQQSASFYYQLANFKKQQLLVDKSDCDLPDYIHQYASDSQLLVQNNRYSIISLCTVKEEIIDQWLELIAELMVNESSDKPIFFILVDNFLC